MFAIEFETTIDQGIVHIPEHYPLLQNLKKAKIIVMVEDAESPPAAETSVFDDFLKQGQKIGELSLPSRDECHER